MALESAHTAISGISTRTTDVPLPVKPENYPKPTEEAMEFLETVVHSDFYQLMFSDELVTVSESGKALGEFSVTVSSAKKHQQDCFLIHANSHGAIDGVPCGTSITAFISKTLETLEQQHHEYVKLENHAVDKKTFIVKQGDEYVVSKTVTQEEKTQRTSHTFEAGDMRGFISEGSNLLLQRLLVKKGLPDNFQVISFDADTNLCRSPYNTISTRSQTIDGVPILVSGIQRSIESMSDLPTLWQSYFDQYGHLTSRVQVGSPVIMKVMKIPDAIVKDEFLEKPVFEKQPLNWEDDPQLQSRFQDRMEELQDDHAMYMRHHPELHCILADFLQYLLLRKPDDTLNFAGEYFASFSTRSIDRGAFSTSTAPTPFPVSRTNTLMSITSQQTKK